MHITSKSKKTHLQNDIIMHMIHLDTQEDLWSNEKHICVML